MELANYDARLAHDIDARDALANASQRERDARRADYDVAQSSQPITLALRALRVPPSPQSNNAWRHTPRVHVDWSLGTCNAHGKPWVGRYACRVCDPTKNAWERRDPNLGGAKPPDHACHHPLVRCNHKW